jgi:hypothetical protein
MKQQLAISSWQSYSPRRHGEHGEMKKKRCGSVRPRERSNLNQKLWLIANGQLLSAKYQVRSALERSER